MNVNVFGPHQWRLIEQLTVCIEGRLAADKTQTIESIPYDTQHNDVIIPDISHDTLCVQRDFLTNDPHTMSQSSTQLPTLLQSKEWDTLHGIWMNGLWGLWSCLVLAPPCHLCAASMADFSHSLFCSPSVASPLFSFLYDTTKDDSTNRDTDRSKASKRQYHLLEIVFELHDQVNKKLDNQCLTQFGYMGDTMSQVHRNPFFRVNRLDFPTFRRRIVYETAFTYGQIRFEEFLSFLHLQFAFFRIKYDREPWAQRTGYYLFTLLRILFVYSFPFAKIESPLSLCLDMTDVQYTNLRTWLRHPSLFPFWLKRSPSARSIVSLSQFLQQSWHIMIEEHECFRIPIVNQQYRHQEKTYESNNHIRNQHDQFYRQYWAAQNCSESRCL